MTTFEEWLTKPLPELHAAAESGIAEAQDALGLKYMGGFDGLPEAPKTALKWWRKAAENNYAAAQCKLGVQYESGVNIDRDYVQAARWYRLAADQGSSSGQFALGRLYALGQGVPQDFGQAAFWNGKAAEQGHREAQRNQEWLLKEARKGAPPCEQRPDFLPYEDVIQGALYDERGVAFIVFTRCRDGNPFAKTVRTMAQTPGRNLLVVCDIATKGIVFRKWLITMKDVAENSFQFVPTQIRDAYADSMAETFAMIAFENKLHGGHLYTPADFWNSLSEKKTAEAMQLARR